MDAAFEVCKALLGGSLGLLLMGLFFRLFRSHELPDPNDPSLSAGQRSGIWQVQEAVRESPLLIRIGVVGTVVCGSGLVVAAILR
jgi:hypothetical protein